MYVVGSARVEGGEPKVDGGESRACCVTSGRSNSQLFLRVLRRDSKQVTPGRMEQPEVRVGLIEYGCNLSDVSTWPW